MFYAYVNISRAALWPEYPKTPPPMTTAAYSIVIVILHVCDYSVRIMIKRIRGFYSSVTQPVEAELTVRIYLYNVPRETL